MREKDTSPVCTDCVNNPRFHLASVDGAVTRQCCDRCLADNLRAMGLPARIEATREDPTQVIK